MKSLTSEKDQTAKWKDLGKEDWLDEVEKLYSGGVPLPDYPEHYIPGGYEHSAGEQEVDVLSQQVQDHIHTKLVDGIDTDPEHGNRLGEFARTIAFRLYTFVDRCRCSSLADCVSKGCASSDLINRRDHEDRGLIWSYVKCYLNELSIDCLVGMIKYPTKTISMLACLQQETDGMSGVVANRMRYLNDMRTVFYECRGYNPWGQPCTQSRCAHERRVSDRFLPEYLSVYREMSFYAEILLKRWLLSACIEKWQYKPVKDVVKYIKDMSHNVSGLWANLPSDFKCQLKREMQWYGHEYYQEEVYTFDEICEYMEAWSRVDDLRYWWDLDLWTEKELAKHLNKELANVVNMYYCLEYLSGAIRNSLPLYDHPPGHSTRHLTVNADDITWTPWTFDPQEYRRREGLGKCKYCSMEGGMVLKDLLSRIDAANRCGKWDDLQIKGCPYPKNIVDGWRNERQCLECGMQR